MDFREVHKVALFQYRCGDIRIRAIISKENSAKGNAEGVVTVAPEVGTIFRKPNRGAISGEPRGRQVTCLTRW
jgi:hypothetical protein